MYKLINNTWFLLIKFFVSSLTLLITTRIVLKALGEIDYGIYFVVSGSVIFLSFLNGAMVVTSQRYLSYYMGKKQDCELKEVFSASKTVHIYVSVLLVLLFLIAYFFIFDGVLQIPPEKFNSAKIVYAMVIIATVFNVLGVPYDALINAHEDFKIEALIGITESLLKLSVAFILLYSFYDRLITYAILTSVISITIRIIKYIWVLNTYPEAKNSKTILFRKNQRFLHEMLSFGGWNLFGSICYVASSQGINLVLNHFLGAVINTSYSISNQVNSQLKSFSVLIVKGINPQIMKREGGGKMKEMLSLSLLSSKMSTFLLLLLAVPFLLEMPFILSLWLEKVPQYTLEFSRIMVLLSLINQLSTGIKSAIQAKGNIGLYQGVLGTFTILTVPAAYLLLRLNYTPEHVLWMLLLAEIISLGLRIIISKQILDLPPWSFLIKVFFPLSLIFLSSLLVGKTIQNQMNPGYSRLFILTSSTGLISFILFLYFGIGIKKTKIIYSSIKLKLHENVFKKSNS